MDKFSLFGGATWQNCTPYQPQFCRSDFMGIMSQIHEFFSNIFF